MSIFREKLSESNASGKHQKVLEANGTWRTFYVQTSNLAFIILCTENDGI